MRFRFEYYGLDGLQTYLTWDDIDAQDHRIIKEMNPTKRILRGQLTYCVAIDSTVRLRKPWTIKQVAKIAKKCAENRSDLYVFSGLR